MNNLITEVDILEESKEAFLTYTEEVLTDRAIPSAEDGLLSVHRKLLWTMNEVLGMTNKSKFKKSASIVGTTLASSYFHGDTACYGALCKIAQPYLMRYPLIEGDGNLGTQEGNGMEAAARYTNAKPSKYADLMLHEFKKKLVPLKETYNGEYMEPVVLPSLLPNAIVNGRETIAIGMAHNSLPNNLTETCDAIIAHIQKGEKLTIDELMAHMKGPDFPLPNDIINSKDIKEAYETGKSKVSLKVRGKYEIENENIVFNTIPYRTYRNKIKEQINKNIDEFDTLLDDFSDESNVGKNKLVFKIKKGVSASTVLNKLFALTDLQTTLSYNMNYIVDGTPKMCSMMDLVEAYVNHQTNLIIKSAQYDMEKALARKHIIEGLLLVIANIDKAIQLIKSSTDKKDAEVKLINEFSLSPEQAKAVLDMKLSKLTKLDENSLLSELKDKIAVIEDCEKTINIKEYRNSKLISIIEDLKNKYGDERRTNLLNIETPKGEEQIIDVVPEDVVITITKDNTIKRTPIKNFKIQKKRGKGVKNPETAILDTISTNTIDDLILFTSKGKMYKTLVDKIPEGKSIQIGAVVPLDDNEKVVAVTSLNRKEKPKYVLFFTALGLIKKTSMEEYSKVKKTTGIQAIKLNDGDRIIDVSFANEEDVIIITKKGMSIKFDTRSINPIGRIAAGVKSIKLSDGDEVVAGLVIKNNSQVGIITEKGYGKRTNLSEFVIQGRGGKGTIAYKPNDVTGDIVGAFLVEEGVNVLISGDKNICISIDDLPLLGKLSIGNILTKDNIVSSVTKI